MISEEESERRQWMDVSGESAWDVGANAGQSIVKLLVLGFSRVLSFEPCALSFVQAAERFGSDPRVTLINQAISSHDGAVELEARAYPMQSGQLVSPEMPVDWGASSGLREVPCRSLDSLFDQHGAPDFVKIDTEGHECEVLRGAQRLLESGCCPAWLVECHYTDRAADCQAMFTTYGYQVERIGHHEHLYMCHLKATTRHR